MKTCCFFFYLFAQLVRLLPREGTKSLTPWNCILCFLVVQKRNVGEPSL